MQKLRAEKGITLIALVITIIVMLILVGVSVTVALKGGLFITAKQAKENTATERDKELNLSDGKVTINGEEYNSIDEYVSGGSGNGAGGQGTTITPKKETYTVGEEVAIGTENFYVIADDANKVTLLAKDCIDTINLVQSTNPNGIVFSQTAYWTDPQGGDLIETGEPDPSHEAAKAAYDYGVKLGGTGRMMTEAEAIAIQTVNSDILYVVSGVTGEYWLACASDDHHILTVSTSENRLNYAGPSCWDTAPLRPVVEISKADIS